MSEPLNPVVETTVTEPVVKKAPSKTPKAPTTVPQTPAKNEVKLPSGLVVTYN